MQPFLFLYEILFFCSAVPHVNNLKLIYYFAVIFDDKAVLAVNRSDAGKDNYAEELKIKLIIMIVELFSFLNCIICL